MFYFLVQCIRVFGFRLGLLNYIRIKILKSGKFWFPKLRQTVHYRPHTLDVHTFREVFLREEYNFKLPPDFHVTTIIDAGANIGFTTLFFLQRFPGAAVISLEPDPENFVLLQKNVTKQINVTSLRKAVWHKTGPIKITDHGYGVRGFVVEDVSDSTLSTMPAISISELVLEYRLSNIDILKMDIEGSEKEIFESDTSWLSITRCLIIELHDRMKPGCSKAVFTRLIEHNFELSIQGENLVFINRDL